jgi:DNA-3-methyladenine glycosylase I
VARQLVRCAWAGGDPLMVAYHDDEWGVPQHNDQRLFEKISLEGAQAGLSWSTILNKREGYRRAFSGFDPKKVARFTPAKVERLLLDPGIVRNRAKIESTITNARAVLDVQRELGSLDAYLWSFVDGTTIVNRHRDTSTFLAQSDISLAMSKDMKKRGFRFVGPTTMYALMQSVGMVNDHTTDCFRWKQLGGTPARAPRRRQQARS